MIAKTLLIHLLKDGSQIEAGVVLLLRAAVF